MADKRILIVEDHKDHAELISYNLKKEGYQVLCAGDGKKGLQLAETHDPDLVLLDIMLPGMDGMEFLRQLRQNSDRPVIFLTAKKSEADRVVGLKLGADDYVTKPFSLGELMARINAILRRADVEPAADGPAAIKLGEVEVDLSRHEVWHKGTPVLLTPTEFEILKRLIEARGKVLSRDVILDHIWGKDKSLEMDTRTVDQHIARLRRKFKSEKRRIATVTNYGYQIRLS